MVRDMVVITMLFLGISAFDVSALSESTTREIHHNNDNSELQELKLKAAQLESILEETVKDVMARNNYLKEHEKLLEEMTNKIDHLQSSLLSTKVRSLWDASRKNNFDLHVLESKAQDTENKLEELTSQVETMASIVTEQWIQIQRLEQALLMAQKRKPKAQKELRSRCTFLKFVDTFSGHHFPELLKKFNSNLFGEESTLNSYMSLIVEGASSLFETVKTQHHQLQQLVKQEMEKNELTAPLANEEVVFFVVSALITFPILGFWMFLSS